MLIIGTELKSATACDPVCWRALIGEIRAAYHGPITYAANWDEAERVPFWDALDFIGVDAYAPIAHTAGAKEPELCLAWGALAKELEALSKRTKKRVILTELGYRATRDAAMAPATWPESDPEPALRRRASGVAIERRSRRCGASQAGGRLRLEMVHRQQGRAGPTDFHRQTGGVRARRILSS
jgi:hypothetical protein